MNKMYKSHKIALLIVLFTCLTVYQTAWAQVANYTFASTSGTYTPIIGGTVVVATTTTPPADEEEYPGLPIGFPLTFNGLPFTTFGIGANGYIWLGADNMANVILGLTLDLAQIPSLGEIRYQTTGTSPNRTTTIQFSNWTNNFSPGDIYNFQIKIRETTNTVSVVYGNITATSSVGVGMLVGIFGVNPDFTARTITNTTTNNWANSTTSISPTPSPDALLSSTIFPTSGLTYTWSPPLTPVCTSVPTSSNTISPLTACASIPFTLSLSASNLGNTYQWQSSPTLGGTYLPISGANAATYSAIQTVNTAYRCIISCVASASSVTSTAVLVTMNTTSCTLLYCTASVGNSIDTDIGNVTFGTLNNGVATPVTNNVTATGTYTNFTTLPAASFARSGGYPISISQITSGSQFYNAVANIFIDYNQNGTFDANERALTTGQTTQIANTVTGGIIISATALLGSTRMRVILLEGGTSTTPACNPLGGFDYGEVEDYTINITVANVCPIPTFTNTTATAASVGVAYSLNAGATVASGPALSYSVSPTLPAGLFINTTTGLISGTPTGGGTPSTTYTVSAFQVGCTPSTQNYTFLVNPPPCAPITFVSTTAPNGTVGIFYVFSAGATVAVGGALSYTVSPALPAGMFLDTSTGQFLGMPTAATLSATYTVTASQFGCPSNSRGFTFAINIGATCSPIIFTNPTAPAATVNVFYTFNAGATVATGPALSYASVPLPAGLTLNTTTGVISGTPTTVTASTGYAIFAIQTGCPNAFRTLNLVVNAASTTCSPIIFTNTTAPNATVNIFYSFNAGATVATGPALSYISSALPAGLSINPTTGVISGTATTAFPFVNFTVFVSQVGCPDNTRNFIFAVNPAGATCSAVIFNNITSPNATLGVAYNFDAGAAVTTTLPLSYSVSPSLPAGLLLSATTGIISGTPTTATTATGYTITAGQVGCPQVTRTFTFAVTANASCVALVFANLIAPNAYIGTPYSFSANAVAVAGGSVTYSVSPALPAGLSLNTTTGLITGTPTTIIPIIAINYIVVASQVGCSPSARAYAFAVTGNPATSIDNSLSNQVKVSPNPSSGDFNIDFGTLNVDKSVVFIYDVQGKLVFSTTITQNSVMAISLKDFASGIYLMKVQTSKGTILKRLAKQ